MAENSAAFCKDGKSKIHKNLDRDALFADGWWLEYCICGGRVVGDIGNPFCGSEGKQLCQHGTCELTQVGDPFCMEFKVFLCITEQCQFPKLEGSPTCVCFNKPLAGADGVSGWKPELFEFKGAWEQQFWIYYILCLGCSVHAPSANDRPICGAVSKFFCIKEGMKCVPPVENGTFCASVGTGLCYWDQCQFPPAENNPKCGCCGWKMNKTAGKSNGGKAAPMSYGKPGQIEMS